MRHLLVCLSLSWSVVGFSICIPGDNGCEFPIPTKSEDSAKNSNSVSPLQDKWNFALRAISVSLGKSRDLKDAHIAFVNAEWSPFYMPNLKHKGNLVLRFESQKKTIDGYCPVEIVEHDKALEVSIEAAKCNFEAAAILSAIKSAQISCRTAEPIAGCNVALE